MLNYQRVPCVVTKDPQAVYPATVSKIRPAGDDPQPQQPGCHGAAHGVHHG